MKSDASRVSDCLAESPMDTQKQSSFQHLPRSDAGHHSPTDEVARVGAADLGRPYAESGWATERSAPPSIIRVCNARMEVSE